MSIKNILQEEIKKAVIFMFKKKIKSVELQATRKEFDGDITLVVFDILHIVKENPFDTATKIGKYLKEKISIVEDFNVVRGFLNLKIADGYFKNEFKKLYPIKNFGIANKKENQKAVMIEYSSPNTNKPLHLGHIRNNLLGYSVAKIIESSGRKVLKTQIINDRGIHICKSMIAWKKFGNEETPQNTGLKGDKLVGNYYVAFNKAYKEEIKELINAGKTKKEAEKQAPILLEAQQMLLKWEEGDKYTIDLWRKMNKWVYDGFETTYKALGVDFDKNYFESNTYILGKNVVTEGLKKEIFYQKKDGSIWIDLKGEGLDEKIVRRSDGTSVYITQDIGTAIERFKDFNIDSLTYVVGNEQDYHFKALFLILKKMGFGWADNMHHLSYGMVDLPSGKMKSRKGTVVDADDLIKEMINTAREISIELGKLEGFSDNKKEELYKIIGLGALKYYILKVDPKKRILFDPKKSVDFNGNTAPFVQYTYARIQSILRKSDFDYSNPVINNKLNDKERELIKQIQLYPENVQLAAKKQNPALIANYIYKLVKEYNSFYQSYPILGCEDESLKIFRIQLSKKVGEIIKSGFELLGIKVPEKM